ncbi:exported protein of unknown function [Streptomyces sp. KY75]|nr:exported protein of unknown function [Streptomyces sp. KY75]CAD5988483.1 exported protein of unknown function [Streptomyces sp. KY70]
MLVSIRMRSRQRSTTSFSALPPPTALPVLLSLTLLPSAVAVVLLPILPRPPPTPKAVHPPSRTVHSHRGVIEHPRMFAMVFHVGTGTARETDTLSGWRNGRRASLRC